MPPYDEHSAGFVLYRLERGAPHYLLLQYNEGFWDLIKGHLEKGESAIDAAIRECREETGIDTISVHEGFTQMIDYWFTHNKKRIHKRVDFFLAKTDTEEVTLTEHKSYEWLPYPKAIERATHQSAKDLLRAAHAHLQEHP